MPITLVNTPTSMLDYLVARYNSAQLDQAIEAMSLYLEEEGQALLDLFMDPKTRNLGSDVSVLLKHMPRENLHRLIVILDDHIGKTYPDEVVAEEAEYNSDVMDWVSRNPESWRI